MVVIVTMLSTNKLTSKGLADYYDNQSQTFQSSIIYTVSQKNRSLLFFA